MGERWAGAGRGGAGCRAITSRLLTTPIHTFRASGRPSHIRDPTAASIIFPVIYHLTQVFVFTHHRPQFVSGTSDDHFASSLYFYSMTPDRQRDDCDLLLLPFLNFAQTSRHILLLRVLAAAIRIRFLGRWAGCWCLVGIMRTEVGSGGWAVCVRESTAVISTFHCLSCSSSSL